MFIKLLIIKFILAASPFSTSHVESNRVPNDVRRWRSTSIDFHLVLSHLLRRTNLEVVDDRVISRIDGCVGIRQKRKRNINNQFNSILCFRDTLSSLETNILLSLTSKSLGSPKRCTSIITFVSITEKLHLRPVYQTINP